MGLMPGQSVRDLCWTKWHLAHVFVRVILFSLLSIVFPAPVFNLALLLSDRQSSETLERAT